jgi:UDP-N-acetylmuramate dehydrogenase
MDRTVETVRKVITDKLSTFRTEHRFLHFAEIHSPDEFLRLRTWAQSRSLQVFILGRGSNTLFARRSIRTLVLQNSLPRDLQALEGNRFRISSSVNLSEVLRLCRERSLDSFYYLAAVPASVGGALAMNAGRGPQFDTTIYDFVESVTALINGREVTLPGNEIQLHYRRTPFRGVTDSLILSAIFHFPATVLETDPIADRLRYSRQTQDLSAPNCGSALSLCDGRIMVRLMGTRIMGAEFSRKTPNWIVNHSRRPLGIVMLLRMARMAHWLLGRSAETEYVEVR